MRIRMLRTHFALAIFAVLTLFVIPSFAQNQAQDDADQLAKQLANPVAALISVPFQFN